MAIIVEEGKKKNNLLAIAGWVLFLAIVGVSAYYIFFTEPQLVPIAATGTLSTIAPIANIKLDPQTIVSSTQFESLQSDITLPTPEGPTPVGRPNPFIAP
jgi:hypothetical protein